MESDKPGSTIKSVFRNMLSFGKQNKKNIWETHSYINLEKQQREMIRGVVDLKLQNARDIMIPRVDIIAIDSETEFRSIIKIICDAGHSRIPVFEKTIDNVIGILYVKDLLKLLGDRVQKKFTLKKKLHKPYFIPETITLSDLLVEFKKRKQHIAIVVDEYGGLGGVVTLEDVLEEIVGEIEDEFDEEALPEFEKTGDDAYEVDSRMQLSDFNSKLELNLPLQEFETIGGYILDLFGKIPKKGDTITDKNIVFKIKDITGTVINRISLTISNTK